jgi:DNA-binding response OmpR family regulator
MRAYLRATLENAGIEAVLEAHSGVEALRALTRDSITLMLLDINMPDLSGIEVLAFMRRTPAYRAIAVLMVTTEGHDVDRQRALDLGANGYVTKPFTADELLAAMAPFRVAS